jgi:alcohol dehydrogenase class IV
MQFELCTTARIIFGAGKVSEIGKHVENVVGNKVMLVHGGSQERSSRLVSELEEHNLRFVTFSVTGEPTVDIIRKSVNLFRRNNCDLVIAIGGGSVIDAGKAIAVLSANDGDIDDYLEVIGKGMDITKPGFPMYAVPTTAGTGSEVTRNAVIGVPEHRIKVSLRSQYLLPTIAIIDPELSYSMPPNITASTGIDALTQLIEPFVSNRANPVTDVFCREGIRYVRDSIRIAYRHGNDVQSREKMSLASMFSGFALANAKLGAVHGFAGVLGGMYHAPHGAICAALLPPVITVNIESLQARKPGSIFLSRYKEIAQILTGKADSEAEDLVDFIWYLIRELSLPPLSTYGIVEEDYPEIIVKAAGSSSMQGNPILLNPDELLSILEMAS